MENENKKMTNEEVENLIERIENEAPNKMGDLAFGYFVHDIADMLREAVGSGKELKPGQGEAPEFFYPTYKIDGEAAMAKIISIKEDGGKVMVKYMYLYEDWTGEESDWEELTDFLMYVSDTYKVLFQVSTSLNGYEFIKNRR